MKILSPFFMIVLSVFMVSCASNSRENSIPKIPLTSNQPVFIDKKPNNNNVFITIKSQDTLIPPENLRDVLAKSFSEKGYKVVGNKSIANSEILLYINNFTREEYRYRGYNYDPFFDCDAFFGCRRYDPFFDDEIFYIYSGDVSLQIKIKNGKKVQSYEQNLYFKNKSNGFSYERILNGFYRSVSDRIINYFDF